MSDNPNLLFTMRVFRKDLSNHSQTIVWRTVVNEHVFNVVVRLTEKRLRTLSDIFFNAIYRYQYRNLHHLLYRNMLKLTVQK